MWTPPDVEDFKGKFVRDFPYQPDGGDDAEVDLSYIQDADIESAIDEAQLNFNSGLFGTEAQATTVFLYLAAFYLVQNIQNSTKGLAAQSRFAVSQASVGGVSTSYAIPDRYTKDPYIAQFTQNAYGMKYLSFVLPLLSGRVDVVEGTTTTT
jgi:hypothetical protein